MVRYVRQSDKYSCGPTAIINAIKWAGYSYPSRDNLMFVARACSSSYEFGTEEADLERVLRQLTCGFLRVRKRCRPTIDELARHVAKPDCAAIVLYYHSSDPSGPGHYTLMTDADAGHVILVNDTTHETVTRSPRCLFSLRLRNMRDDRRSFPQAWLLRRYA